MNTNRLSRRHLFLAMLALAALATSVWAAERIMVPQDRPLPLYVQGLGHTGLERDDWIGTAFFYPPDDIPGDYDLFSAPVHDPPVGVETPNVQGFMVVGSKSPLPAQISLENVPGTRVPIWFIRVGEWYDWNGTWTVNTMKAQNPLKGWADSYRQVVEPGMPGHNTVVASGFLEDGTPFSVESHVTQAWDKNAQAPDCRVHFGP
jgi:hypothetical protein